MNLANTVVVGIDGSLESLAAARFGLWCAETEGLDLLLAYACTVPGGAITGLHDVDRLRQAGQGVIDRALAQLAPSPEVQVRTMIEEGSAAVMLARLSRTAREVVVGEQRSFASGRLVHVSVGSTLARTCHCLLTIVPRLWRPTLLQGPVLVLGNPSTDALLQAVIAAERLKVGVQAVDKSLVQCSAGASLVVLEAVGSPATGVWPWSLVRRLLNDTGCPVLVVPAPEISASVLVPMREAS